MASGDIDTTTGVGTELLVDGQQRLTTLLHYFIGSKEITVGKQIQPYSALTEQQKLDFLEYEVVVRDLGSMDENSIVDVFKRINATQYALNTMEIDNAEYHGEFKKLAIEIADDKLFSHNLVFSANEVRRMSDVSFALTLIATVMSTYFNRDKELTNYLERYNDAFDARDDIKNEIDQVFRFVNSLGLDIKSRAWNRADLFTLLVEVHRCMFRDRLELDPKAVSERLIRFYDEVNKRDDVLKEGEALHYDYDVLQTYYQAAVQATNDRGNRALRGTIIQSIIKGNDPGVELVLSVL